MSQSRDELVWFNGTIIPAHETNSGIFDHSHDYGSSIFDGVRLYGEKEKRCFLRLRDHVERALEGAKLYQMPVTYSVEDLMAAYVSLAQASPHCKYFRLRIWHGESTKVDPTGRQYTIGGVDPRGCPVQVAVIADNWKAYLSPDVYEHGAGVIMSPYARPWPNVGNTAAKGPANYATSQLPKLRAQAHKFMRADGQLVSCADAVMLTPDGYVSEMTGANIFVRKGDRISTPPKSDCILAGITRDTTLRLMKSVKRLVIVEERIPLMQLLVADEIVAVGSAAEVSPIVWVFGNNVGDGKPGEFFRFLKGKFELYISDGLTKDTDPNNFLTIFTVEPSLSS